MQWISRSFAPLWVAAMLALAGCQTAPMAADNASAAPAAPAPAPAEAAAQPAPAPEPVPAANQVAFYIGQTHSEPSLTAIKTVDGMLYVQRVPLLTREDISQANALVDKKQGKHFVGLRFTEAGARKLNDASKDGVGKRLVLIIDGKVAAAPEIKQPLNRGVLAFGVPSAKAAATLAARIRGEQKPAASKK
jgi:preprotein translocase subunit SecD